jgi:very-short-patch-repair endonuclease
MGDPPVLLLAPHDMRITDNDDVQVHRTLDLPESDIIRRDDGIRLTTPARTLFDLGRALDDDALASVVEQVLDMKLASLEEISETNRRLSRRGRAGSGRLTRVLGARGNAAALQSDLEHAFEQAVLKAGLPAPERQFPVRLRNGQLIRVDFAWPAVMVAVEIDGDYFHDGYAERRRDKLRDRRLTAMGWAVSRVHQYEVRTGLREAIGDLTRTILERSQLFGQRLS